MRTLRPGRRGAFGHPLILLAVAGVATVAVLSFVPLPGQCNVAVSVGVSEVSIVVANYFSVTGISGTSTGKATVLDWGSWIAGFAPPALAATFTATACVGGSSHCSTRSETQWFPTVPVANGATLTASDTFPIGYVPAGSQPITFTLTQSGAGTVASGSGSMTVGC